MPIDPSRESWKPGMDWDRAVDDIHYIRGLAGEMGGPEGIRRQHQGGRFTIRERIEKFLDPGSFIEAQPLVGAADYDEDGNLTGFTPGGYVMGLGEIGGRPIAIGGDDFTISGGARTTSTNTPVTSPSPWRPSTASPTCSSWRASATAPRPMRPVAAWSWARATSGGR